LRSYEEKLRDMIWFMEFMEKKRRKARKNKTQP